MAVPECFVDGDVPRWDSEDEDSAGAEIYGLVVYHPAIGRRAFEAQCDRLEDRAWRRSEALLEASGRRGFRFGLVDRRTAELADAIVDDELGESYLSNFVNDTHMVSLEHFGAALRDIHRMGVTAGPGSAAETVEVTAAKSFRNEKALVQYLQEGKASWRPSVRLSARISLDGPLAAVENAASRLRQAMSDCGPVTEWRVKLRPAREAARAEPLRLVVG